MNTFRVLIVEDNPDQAWALAQLLAAAGFTALTVGSLTGAMPNLAHDVDCVILDLNLPDARGTEAVSRITAAYPGLPIVVVTGTQGLERECLHAGAQEVISKLANISDVTRAVRCAFYRHQVRRQFQPYVEALKQATDLAEGGLKKSGGTP